MGKRQRYPKYKGKKRRFLPWKFRSIQMEIATATALLIIAIVSSIVWMWVKSESDFYSQQKQEEAELLAVALAGSWVNELLEENWNQIRVGIDLLVAQKSEVVYALVSDVRLQDRIIAAFPREFQQQYVPDIVPLAVTQKAIALVGESQIETTFVLTDVESADGKLRARRGEMLIEVAANLNNASGEKIGTLRIGISLRQFNRNLVRIVTKTLIVGVVGLTVGVVAACFLGRHLSQPLRRLQASVAQIAVADLSHRAQVDRQDEIGVLATAFNEMAAALQESFNQLEKTAESFERFVPNKFLKAIARDGIENIQVGVASKHVLTILFCDIRGYTAMSELMTPMEIFLFLNEYLACMGEAIEEAGGFIDKYIGDAIMALFDCEEVDCVLKAALAMRCALADFNQKRIQNNLPAIEVGIGIHRGEAVMGTVGFVSRIESTAIGDAVNLASRVEELTKVYGYPILVTEAVVKALLHPSNFELEVVDDAVKVKGKEEAIAIYKLGRDKFFQE